MALETGRRLGAFEILGPIGAGGMGEVYRARDTRLDRTVALKVLPAELSDKPALRERFEREARAASRLAHSHICTLHDVGQDQGIDFLVMEHLEGETLADRLRKGPLPLEQALRRATEIAEALDAAHRQGIVHRDLKPGNVMLTKSGAKLLDFGLAQLLEGDPSGPGTSASATPTEHRPLTEIGTILGTYPYMAPEQLEGKETDGRADLFAFGAMLHEMVTGHRAFQGESRASLIAAILEREPPPVSSLQPLTPSGLDHLIHRCLEKDPDDRWQSARDVASQLRWISEVGSQVATPAPVVRRRARERLAWGVTAAVMSVLAAGGTWAWKNASEETPRVVRSSLLAPEKAHVDPFSGAMVLSPDGTRLAFVARRENGAPMLWVRPLDRLTAQPLAGTENALDPFWSPDSRFIGFFSDGKLRKIDASGGPAQALCDASGGGRGGTWGADGTILFTPSSRDVIYRVPASGGTPVPVTVFDESRSEVSHRLPQFLPDGNRFIFLVWAAAGMPDTDSGLAVFAASLDSLEKTSVVASSSPARYATSGHLLFVRDRTLVAQPFDPDTLELTGDAVPVAENMGRSSRLEAIFSVSDTGLLLFQAGAASEVSRLVWLDRDGQERGTIGKPADYRSPALSHDQKRIAVRIRDPQTQLDDIWVLDIERGTSTRLTFDPADDYRPLWSADDRTIYFTSWRSGKGDVYSKSSSGTGAAELVYGGEEWDLLWSLSPDGTTGWLFSDDATTKAGYDIYRVDLESHEAEVVLQTSFRELAPAISPDGRWLLYHSNETGRNEVYVQSLVDDGGKWQISTEGGDWGKWTRDGREIVFLAAAGSIMAVQVALNPTFSAGIPEVLFDPGESTLQAYDVTPDGRRFLVGQLTEQSGGQALTLVQNWASELER